MSLYEPYTVCMQYIFVCARVSANAWTTDTMLQTAAWPHIFVCLHVKYVKVDSDFRPVTVQTSFGLTTKWTQGVFVLLTWAGVAIYYAN